LLLLVMVVLLLVLVLLMWYWYALERVESSRREVRLGGGRGDVEVLGRGPRGELVLAQEGVEVGAVVGERVVVKADHWGGGEGAGGTAHRG